MDIEDIICRPITDDDEWLMSPEEEWLQARASRMRQQDGLPRIFNEIAEEIGRTPKPNSAPALYNEET